MRREDFPQISDEFVYFDNAATTFKPQCVLDAMDDFYRHDNANTKRGFYALAQRATECYEAARKTVAGFIGADTDEVIFTRGATESLNMVARGLELGADDTVVVGITEHHSNMLPWRETGAKIGYLYCDEFENHSQIRICKAIKKGVKVVAITAYSNILGQNLQLDAIIKRAHEVGAIVVVDAAQAVAHQRINVREMDADFLAFSGHKVYGPIGIGVLYGKRQLLEKLRPSLFGGEMVDEVSTEDYTLASIPERFEAGTMNVAGAIGLAAAIDYLNEHDYDTLLKYEQKLNTYAFNKLRVIPYLELAGAARSLNNRSSVLCFWLRDVHSHDISAFLDSDSIYLRAGYHCAQPLLEHIGKGPCTRASLCFYNTFEEVDRLTESLAKIRGKMGLNG